MRIDPSLADAFYGRRTALMMSEPRRLVAYSRGARGVVQSEEMQRIDSLLSQAFLLNPMLPMRLERTLTVASIVAYVEQGGGPRLTLSEKMEIETSSIGTSAARSTRRSCALAWRRPEATTSSRCSNTPVPSKTSKADLVPERVG